MSEHGYHALFMPDENEDFPPEEILYINVMRHHGAKKIPDSQAYDPEQLPNLQVAGDLFGSGEYTFVARRKNAGPDGQKAGTVCMNKRIVIPAEFGPPKRMLPPDSPLPAAPSQNGNGHPAAPSMSIPGMPPVEAMQNPMVMMMWMMHETRQAEERARREAREQHDRSEARMMQFFQVLGQSQNGNGNLAAAIPAVVSSVAETFRSIHAPPAPPPSPPGIGPVLNDLRSVAEVAKTLKPNDDVELVKAIGQGLAGLAGVGMMGIGGGGGGMPPP